MQRPSVVLHGVVFGHSAQLLDTKYTTQVQLLIHWPVGRLRLGGRHPEALVEPGQKFGQHSIRLRQGASASEPQFCYQPVLEGSIGSFHPTFGLGTVS